MSAAGAKSPKGEKTLVSAVVSASPVVVLEFQIDFEIAFEKRP